MRRRSTNGKFPRGAVIFAIIAAIVLILVRAADLRLRSVVEQIAATSACEYSVMTINACVERVLAEGGEKYSNLLIIQSGADGAAAVLRADISAVNTLKAQLTTAIQSDLSQYRKGAVGVAIGTLLGSELFTGKGPVIDVVVLPVGYVNTEIDNEFISAGINQTLHRIMLTVDVDIAVVMSGYTAQTGVSTDFCISETIVVGAVPDAYTEVNEAQDKISSIYDFNAGDVP